MVLSRPKEELTFGRISQGGVLRGQAQERGMLSTLRVVFGEGAVPGEMLLRCAEYGVYNEDLSWRFQTDGKTGSVLLLLKHTIWYVQETYHNIKDRHYLGVQGWKKIFQANGSKKQAGIIILKFDKSYFKPKTNQDRKVQYILIKSKIHQNPCTKHKGTQVHKRNITKA